MTNPIPFDPVALAQMSIRYAVREVRAFVGHSFTDEDADVVGVITELLSKLGFTCVTGQRAAPKEIRDKVKERIESCEVFVGIFTRREPKADGTFTSVPWVIEEKAWALAAGKKLLLFVEEGVEGDIGGLQGNYEYVPFDRTHLAPALLKAVDYVLGVTTVPFQCKVDPSGQKIEFKWGAGEATPPEKQIEQLQKQKQSQPFNPQIVLALSRLLNATGSRTVAIAELVNFLKKRPHFGEVHHALAHLYQEDENLESAVLSFQAALDANPKEYKNYRCYGRCLYLLAKGIKDESARKATLEKAKRLLQRAAAIGGDRARAEIDADTFLVDEALKERGIAG